MSGPATIPPRDEIQEILDRVYWSCGPYCVGCDWWLHPDSLVGERRKRAPAVENERWDKCDGLSWPSIVSGFGHVDWNLLLVAPSKVFRMEGA